MSRQKLVGSLRSPGEQPRNVELVVHNPSAYFRRSESEVSEGVTPVNFQYPPGHVYRYGTNSTAGTTDMTEAVQKAFDSGHIVAFPENDDVLITEEIVKGPGAVNSKAVTIVGNNANLRGDFGSSNNDYLLRIDGGGDTATTTTASSSLTIGGTSLPVADASGFVRGDRIKITSTEYFNGIDGESGYGLKTKGELNQVASKSGNTITLLQPLKDSYTTSGETVTVTKRETQVEVRIDNLRFTSNQTGAPSGSPPTGTRGLGIEHCRDVIVTRCRFFRFPRFAFTASHCEDVNVEAEFVGFDASDADQIDSPWFTGFSAFSCDGVQFNGRGRHCRRIFDADSVSGEPVCRNLTVSAYFTKCGNIGSHACENIIFDRIVGTSSGGIACRGKNVTINDAILTLEAGVSRAISIGHSSESGLDYSENTPVGRVKINNVTLLGAPPERMVRITGDATSVSITNVDGSFTERGFEIEGKVIRNLKVALNTLIGESGAEVGIIVPNYSAGATREELVNTLVALNTFDGEMDHLVSISGAPSDVPAKSTSVIGNVSDCTGILRHIQFRGTVGSDASQYFADPPIVIGNLLGGVPSDQYIQPPQLSGFVAMEALNLTGGEHNCHVVNYINTLAPPGNARTYLRGNVIMNSEPAATEFVGAVCVTSGTDGTLAGVTGTIAGSSDELTVNDASDIAPGAYLTVTGATLTADAHVLSIDGNVITLSESNTGSTATGQAVAYTAPVFKGFGEIES